jgi:hypothetical protein
MASLPGKIDFFDILEPCQLRRPEKKGSFLVRLPIGISQALIQAGIRP